jgi:hypothetical protein
MTNILIPNRYICHIPGRLCPFLFNISTQIVIQFNRGDINWLIMYVFFIITIIKLYAFQSKTITLQRVSILWRQDVNTLTTFEYHYCSHNRIYDC